MRKKKRKYANAIMLLLILFVLFFIVIQERIARISTEELIQSYSQNSSSADKKYLNQDLEISGIVKSIIQSEGEKSLLELQSKSEELKVHCILMNTDSEEKAISLTSGTTVTIYGKCIGLSTVFYNDSSNVIYIKVDKIK